MTSKQEETQLNRRAFLKAAALTAVAATATGAGAALLNTQPDATAITAVSNAALPAAQTAPIAVQAVPAAANQTELLARLAAAQAENARLQTALTSAESQLTHFQAAQQEGASETVALSQELASVNEQVGVLAGLVALYEQLDDVKLDDVVANGLREMSGAVTELLDDVPTLSEGIAAGQQVLDELEAQVPLLENGRIWLADHLSRLRSFYDSSETVLQQAMSRFEPFLEVLNGWFSEIRQWLPFGFGRTAAGVMVALTDLLAETPNTFNGVQTNVAEPLDMLLAGETEPHLKANVIKPLREQLVDKTGSTLAKVEGMNAKYRTELEAPLETAVAVQRRLRQEIETYRQLHQI